MPTPTWSSTDKKYHRQNDIEQASFSFAAAPGTATLLFRARYAAEILGCQVVPTATQAASTANYYTLALHDGGTAGSGTAVVAVAVGGTAAGGTAPGWTAFTPVALTIGASNTLAAGEWMKVVYAGTGSPSVGFAVEVDYVYRDA